MYSRNEAYLYGTPVNSGAWFQLQKNACYASVYIVVAIYSIIFCMKKTEHEFKTGKL